MLHPKLNLKVSQRQVLTPGLVQMVSVLALNKLEPEGDDQRRGGGEPGSGGDRRVRGNAGREAGREATLEQSAEETVGQEKAEKDPFDEIDFGSSYFQDYLDPGFQARASNFEDIERPSFDNFSLFTHQSGGPSGMATGVR